MVDRFVEKPDRSVARTLIDAGVLWNAFIVASRARALLQLFVQRFPQVVIDMQRSSLRTNSLPVSRPRHWISIAICRTLISPAKCCRALNRCSEYCAFRAADGAISGPRRGSLKLCKLSRRVASVQMIHLVRRAGT